MQVSICVSFTLNGVRKEVFIGFCKTQSTAGEVLYKLVKDELEKLNLDLQKLVGKCFDGASNMNGKAKGLAKRMEDCSPLSIYVHCHGHLLNLAVQDNLAESETMTNGLGVVQGLYNFIEASPKRHEIFADFQKKLNMNHHVGCRHKAKLVGHADANQLSNLATQVPLMFVEAIRPAERGGGKGGNCPGARR